MTLHILRVVRAFTESAVSFGCVQVVQCSTS